MVGAVKEAASDRTEKLLGTYSAPILAASVGGLIIWLRQFGGIIGLGVDAASGAINKYPDQITVDDDAGSVVPTATRNTIAAQAAANFRPVVRHSKRSASVVRMSGSEIRK